MEADSPRLDIHAMCADSLSGDVMVMLMLAESALFLLEILGLQALRGVEGFSGMRM
jgi:hypothetical protein